MAAVTGAVIAGVGTAASISNSRKARDANKRATRAQNQLDKAQLEAEKKRLNIELGLAEGNIEAQAQIRQLEIERFATERGTARLGLAQAEQQLRLQAIQSVRENAIIKANLAVAGEAAGIAGSSIAQGAEAQAENAVGATIAMLGQQARFNRNVFNRQEQVAGFGNRIRNIEFARQQAGSQAEIQNIRNQLASNTITGSLSSQIRNLQSSAQQSAGVASDFATIAGLGLSFGSTFG